MKDRIVYPYSDALLNYKFKEDHPLKPERLKLTYLLSQELGLLNSAKVTEPSLATRQELELFHDPEFIDAVQECSTNLCSKPVFGIGTADNPVFPELYDAAVKYVGATLDAMKEIEKGAHCAFAISGGLHHSHKSMASGFCVFNDVAVSILHLHKKKNCKVLYFDFDAHHGDGTQSAFYRSKNVLTISIHESGRYLFPGTGFVHEIGGGEGTGYAVNVPILPGGGSLELMRIMDEVVTPLFESYKPDLLVTQLGVDGHFLDPLAHLVYTTHGYESVLRRIKALSEDICKMGWLAVGGGGYHPANVARLWTLFLSIMLDERIPQRLPEGFIEACTNLGFDKRPEGIRDTEEVVQGYFPREEIELDLERTIRRVREMIFPYHGL